MSNCLQIYSIFLINFSFVSQKPTKMTTTEEEFTLVIRGNKTKNSITFQELCIEQADKFKANPEILNELDSLLSLLVIDLNRLGYYTVCSQSGCKVPTEIPLFKDYTVTSVIHTGEKRMLGYYQQRAQIAGFIKKDTADYLFDKLAKYKNLSVRCGSKTRGTFPTGSMFFDEDLKVISSNSKFAKPYIFSSGIKIYNSDTSISNNVRRKVVDKDEITYFCVMDLRWNNNSMWNILLKLIQKYHSR